MLAIHTIALFGLFIISVFAIPLPESPRIAGDNVNSIRPSPTGMYKSPFLTPAIKKKYETKIDTVFPGEEIEMKVFPYFRNKVLVFKLSEAQIERLDAKDDETMQPPDTKTVDKKVGEHLEAVSEMEAKRYNIQFPEN